MLSLAIWVVKHASNAVKNHALEVATEATGGVHYATMKDRTIEKAMDEIGAELHAQYTLGYKPPGDEPSGFHEIRVTVTVPECACELGRGITCRRSKIKWKRKRLRNAIVLSKPLKRFPEGEFVWLQYIRLHFQRRVTAI